MKLAFRDIEPFVKKPNPAARLVLVFGPDQGLMKERAATIAQTVVADLNDPFNAVIFTPDMIVTDPARFNDEANAQSMMGGNRLIMIRDGSDSLTVLLKEYLENPSPETLVVVEADDLNPRSSLRKLCESAKNAAAVPCYVDDERSMAQIIRDMAGHAGYTIDQDAMIALSSALIGDRAIARNEIEKLILYKGWPEGYGGIDGEPHRAKAGSLSLADVMACSGDIRDWNMDTLVYAVGDGDIQTTHKIIESLFRDATAPIILLRSVQNHFWRLFQVKAKIAAGMNQGDAVETLNPPLFWKVKDAFARQLNRWPITAIESALDALNRAEILTKKTGYVDTMVTKNCLLQLAKYQPRRRAG